MIPLRNFLRIPDRLFANLRLLLATLGCLLSLPAGAQFFGGLVEDSLYSKALHAYRRIDFYIPSAFRPKDRHTVIYCTDGRAIRNGAYQATLDSFQKLGLLRDVILVAVHASTSRISGTDMTVRNLEYAEGLSIARDSLYRGTFARHLSFFADEAIAYAESKLRLRKRSIRRLFYGCSNGGGFGITLSLRRPRLFDGCICLSPLGSELNGLPQLQGHIRTDYFFACGDAENKFAPQEIERVSGALRAAGATVRSVGYAGGHGHTWWKREFFSELLRREASSPEKPVCR